MLFLATAALFLGIGCLYHIENMDKLLYAFLLAAVLWAAAAAHAFAAYKKQMDGLQRAMEGLEQGDDAPFELLAAQEQESAAGMRRETGRLLSLLLALQRADKEERERQEAERRDYFLTWTHQIKTPISALGLLLEEEQRQNRNGFLMREELFKIGQYADMVLSFQRLDSIAQDKLLQQCRLEPILRQSVKKYAVLFINKGIQPQLCEVECSVLTDEKWFAFCFEQILSNSIKYTDKGGKITISTQQTEQGVALRIEDTGIGIRNEDLPRIFERGFTGYNGRLDKKASGIGLYLCRKICVQLGITLTADSEVGKGTVMTFLFPQEEK